MSIDSSNIEAITRLGIQLSESLLSLCSGWKESRNNKGFSSIISLPKKGQAPVCLFLLHHERYILQRPEFARSHWR